MPRGTFQIKSCKRDFSATTIKDIMKSLNSKYRERVVHPNKLVDKLMNTKDEAS